MMLSQGLALLISAGIKISRAWKDALRPIFTVPAVLKVSKILNLAIFSLLFFVFYISNLWFITCHFVLLQHDPTAANIMGTDNLASLSEKATKEQTSLRRVFRPNFTSRSKFKFGKASNQYRFKSSSYKP